MAAKRDSAGRFRRPASGGEERKREDEMELRRGKGGRRQLQRRDKRRSFTKAKQDKFFQVLAATCNVTAAYKAAGVGHHCVYDHRRKYAAFRARWADAVRESYARLELMMVERMLNGTVKTVTRADGSVETIHHYPDWIALQLLRLHRQTAAEAGIEHGPGEIDEARARIADKLERLKARLEREKAEKAAGEGDGRGDSPREGDSPQGGRGDSPRGDGGR